MAKNPQCVLEALGQMAWLGLLIGIQALLEYGIAQQPGTVW